MAARLLLYQGGHKYLCTSVKHGTYDHLMQAPVYLIKPSTLQSFGKTEECTSMSHKLKTSQLIPISVSVIAFSLSK